MTTPPRSAWQFGRIYPPDEPWLATAAPEPILEPDLPIVDPHHHLWLRDGHQYLLDELLARSEQRPQRRRDGVPRMPFDVPRG